MRQDTQQLLLMGAQLQHTRQALLEIAANSGSRGVQQSGQHTRDPEAISNVLQHVGHGGLGHAGVHWN
jgi:hypothetical protein